MAKMDDKDIDATHHELAKPKGGQHNPTGTVKLVEDGEVVLIPTPSPDPRGMVIFLHILVWMWVAKRRQIH